MGCVGALRGKYVVITSDFGTEKPILFPYSMSHSDLKWLNPLRAGFFEVLKEGVKCFGESMTLGLESDPETDAMLIKSLLRQ